jgi:uncharacterized protein YcbK (DUF882 family)
LRFASGGKRVVTAALLSAILASCSTTSDTDTLFGMGPGLEGSSGSSDFSRSTVNSAASTASGTNFVEEGDPLLPDSMTELPASRPGAATAALPQPDSVEDNELRQVAGDVVTASDDQPEIAAEETTLASAASEQPSQGATPRARQNESTAGGFLSAFFSPSPSGVAPEAARSQPQQQQSQQAQQQARPLVALASNNPPADNAARSPIVGADALPGVRQGSLFQITRRSSIDDDSDIDMHEMPGSYQVASAAGLARLAPNGLLTQSDRVDVNCLQPALVRKLQTIERHFGRRVMVTSGFRSPEHNRRARGARNSLHMYCAAADIQIQGVSKTDLAQFVRAMPGRGGVGTYCHTESVHVDIGPERDWNWRCRRRN